eukprot:g7451.t1
MRQLRQIQRVLKLLVSPYASQPSLTCRFHTTDKNYQSQILNSIRTGGGGGGYQHFAKSNRRWGIKEQLGVVGAICAGAGFVYVSNRETVPYTGRSHAIFVSIRRERDLGTAVFQEVKNDAIRNRTLLPESNHFTKLVKSVGYRIANAANDGLGHGYIEHMKDLNWQFIVIDNGEVNAFVVPGGKVVVCSGTV